MKRGGWFSRLRGRPNGTDPFAEMPAPHGATTTINSSPVGVPVASAPPGSVAHGGQNGHNGQNGPVMAPAGGASAVPSGPAEARPAEMAAAPEPGRSSAWATGAWAGLCDHFGVQVLLLAEQLRPALDRLEEDEQDPERLEQLYQVDHAITRMRRCARDLRVLSGRGDDTEGTTSSLVDTIRVAQSAIERYAQVSIGAVVELAVVGYVADDVSSLLAALLDNATRYSPSTVTVSGHLLPDGGVMFRIEDAGIGLTGPHVAALNAVLDSDVPELDDHTARHTGFAIVHRLARKHGIGVRLAARAAPEGTSGGTTAMVTIPPSLLTEIPDPPLAVAPAAPEPAGLPPDSGATAHLTLAHTARRGPVAAVPDTAGHDTGSAEAPATDATAPGTSIPDAGTVEHAGAEHAPPRHAAPEREGLPPLPRREPTSLRGGDGPGPAADVPAPPEPDENEAAEARRSFADDVAAFSGAFADTPEAETPDTGFPAQPDTAPPDDGARDGDGASAGDDGADDVAAPAWPVDSAAPWSREDSLPSHDEYPSDDEYPADEVGRDLAWSEDVTPPAGFASLGAGDGPPGEGPTGAPEDVDHRDDIGTVPPEAPRPANPPESGEQVP